MGSQNPSWFRKHKILTAAGIIVLLIIVGSILGGGGMNVNTTPAGTSGSTKPDSKPAATKAHVGSTINIGGAKGLAITLVKIIDPATGGDQYTTPDPGKRFVAANMKITNNGTSSYQDDANSNVTLIGSDNQSYTADFDGVSECTNFSDGQYTLAAGESTTGCVVFQLPNAVKAAKVQFQTESGFSGSTGEWTVE